MSPDRASSEDYDSQVAKSEKPSRSEMSEPVKPEPKFSKTETMEPEPV